MVESGLRRGLLCISTSFWVLRATESWSKYFFDVFKHFCWFWMCIHDFLPKNLFQPAGRNTQQWTSESALSRFTISIRCNLRFHSEFLFPMSSWLVLKISPNLLMGLKRIKKFQGTSRFNFLIFISSNLKLISVNIVRSRLIAWIFYS